MTAGLLVAGGAPGITPACARAADAHDQYVSAVLAEGYPDGMTGQQQFGVITTELALLTAMEKAGCPGTMHVRSLPDT